MSCSIAPHSHPHADPLDDPDLAPIAPALWLSHPDLRYARCGCIETRPTSHLSHHHRSLPRGCACRRDAPAPVYPYFAPMSSTTLKQPSPDRRILRFLKKRLSWKHRK
eukprot:IDg15148t1